MRGFQPFLFGLNAVYYLRKSSQLCGDMTVLEAVLVKVLEPIQYLIRC
jgi:hypothetical protein